MSAAPLFSIIMPTYNRPAELDRALGSVDQQTARDFELIVVDDASDRDYAAAALRRVHCSRKQLLRHSYNQGAAAARNTGIATAVGTLLTFLDDDDEYARDFLDVTAAALLGTEARIGASWSPINPSFEHVFDDRTQAEGEAALLQDFLSAGAGCGLTIKAECLRRIGGFHEALRIGEDTELFVRFLAAGFRPLQLPANLVKIAKTPSSLTDGTSQALRQKVYRWIRATHAEFLAGHPQLRDRLSPHALSGGRQAPALGSGRTE
jgi:glycosyltransferase involved in cell wall biosynthesis